MQAEEIRVAVSRADVSQFLTSSPPSRRIAIDRFAATDMIVLLTLITWVVRFLATKIDVARLLLTSITSKLPGMVVMEVATATNVAAIPMRSARATATCPTLRMREILISLAPTGALKMPEETVVDSAVVKISPDLATSRPQDALRDQTS